MLRARLGESEIRGAIGLPGSGDLVVDGVAPLDAGTDHCLYYVNRGDPDAVRRLLAGRKGCIVIVPPGFFTQEPSGCRVLEVAHPRTAFARVLEFIRAERRQPPWLTTRRIAAGASVSPLAVLDGNVDIAEGVTVEPFCTIGPDVAIGRDTIVRAGARIGERVTIGARSVIGLNAVLGAEGYGFVRDDDGNKMRIPHLGGIVVGSHVEIDALSVVQYGTMSPTVVEDHAKVGVNVVIGHNARIGRGVSLTAGVIVGGSVAIDEEAWIGINASIRNGTRVGSRSLVGMDASIHRDLGERMVAVARPADVGNRSAEDGDEVIGFTEHSVRR